jgi:outer membrane protein assembly factor BamE (lipoprotein component of BamABCDE complex)
MTRSAVLAVAVVISLQAGACATMGTLMETATFAKLKPGVTTQAELLEWFGRPRSLTLDTNGKEVMVWYYFRAGFTVKQQILSALIDEKKIMEKYTLIDDFNQDEAQQPARE